jgi:hypothetical protein
MDVSEKMGFEIMECGESFKDFLRAIVDIIVEIKDSVSRTMGYQDVCICGDSGIVAALAIGYAIAHEHRDAVEFQPLNFNSGITKVMHIVVKPVDVGSIKAVVMIAANKDFVAIRQVAEPVEKVNRFLLASGHTEISRMYHQIGIGQIPQPTMTAMSI